MGALFGSRDNSAQEARIAEQEKKIAAQEANQAKQLEARRRSSASGLQSKTLFAQVLGTDEALGQKTTFGG